MSHFKKITVLMTDRDALVAAIRALGMEPEVHDQPIRIGSNDSAYAHVVIRREVINATAEFASYEDIGWRFNEDGTVEEIVDEWATWNRRDQRTSGAEVVAAIKPLYTEQRVRAALAEREKRASIVNRQEDDQVIRLTIRGYRPVAGGAGASGGVPARKSR
jgi:hypothetical protein